MLSIRVPKWSFVFFAEIKIESKNYNISIFNYSKIEKKKFSASMLLVILLIKLQENKM